MKILVLNGRPKQDKSDTMHITRAFLDGMNEAACQENHTIHVIDKHVEYRNGCFSCMRNGGTCLENNEEAQRNLRIDHKKVEIKPLGMIIKTF